MYVDLFGRDAAAFSRSETLLRRLGDATAPLLRRRARGRRRRCFVVGVGASSPPDASMGSGSSASGFDLSSVSGETEGAECRRFPCRNCAMSSSASSAAAVPRSASMARRVRRSEPRLLRHGGVFPASTSLFEYTRAPSPFDIIFSGERMRPWFAARLRGRVAASLAAARAPSWVKSDARPCGIGAAGGPSRCAVVCAMSAFARSSAVLRIYGRRAFFFPLD